jgi:hypothetical protein
MADQHATVRDRVRMSGVWRTGRQSALQLASTAWGFGNSGGSALELTLRDATRAELGDIGVDVWIVEWVLRIECEICERSFDGARIASSCDINRGNGRPSW